MIYVDGFTDLARVIAYRGFRGVGDKGERDSVVVRRDCGAGL
tara:strand:- start:8705 stop:8830 length:126 start_codon:yes stop_codon:yes gene_type:complete